jgi:hypothetical protein
MRNKLLVWIVMPLTAILVGCAGVRSIAPPPLTPALLPEAPSEAPADGRRGETVSTPVINQSGRPVREGPLRRPTYCLSMVAIPWPTGMPPPTRGPAAVKRLIPNDKETCLDKGGFWDRPFCSGLMRPTDIPPPEGSCWEVPTSDACRPCSDDSECEGWCSVPPGGQGPPMTGVCSPAARQWQWKRAAILNGQVVEQVRECE